MSFHRRPMLERDIEGYERVLHAAFDKGIMTLLFPHGHTRADIEHSIDSVVKHLRDPTSIYRYNVVLDSSSAPESSDIEHLNADEKEAARKDGRVAGVAVWRMYLSERTDEDLRREAAARDAEGMAPSMDPAFAEVFMSTIRASKNEALGNKAYVLCHILATDSAYHRQGVGALQLKWGLDEADRLHLPAYPEASRMGAPLYERWGFEPVKRLPIDWSRYAAEGQDTEEFEHMVMLRPAREKGDGTGN